MDNETVKIEKLKSGEQFPIWKFQVKIVLKSGELFEHVSGENVKPIKIRGETVEEFTRKLKSWEKSDHQAQRIIVTSLGNGPLQHIINCSTAHEMWEKLITVYEQKSKANIHLLQQRFYSFSKSPDDDVATHISKLETLVRQLRDTGEDISESMIITKILMTLPEDFNHFYSAWESTPCEQQTLANLTSRLVMEEVRHATQMHISTQAPSSHTETALISKKWKKTQNQQEGSHKHRQKPGKCFSCNEKGHWKNECPRIKKSKINMRVSAYANEGRKGDALLCDALTGVKASDDKWYLDSGASDHMCSHREWFVDFRVLEKPIGVRVGNGEVIFATGTGNVNIFAFDGSSWVEKHLSDVLYVPGILMNLFSQNKALDKGLTLSSTKERCFFKKDGSIVAVGVRKLQLFEMCFEVTHNNSVSCNIAAKQDSLKIWHERLAHQNVAHVRDVLKIKSIKFLDTEFFCEACVTGKQCRQPFEKNVKRAESPGRLIHGDVCGPMQDVSIGGARYFLLLKDDFSNFRTIYFLKHKSEVFRHFQKYIKKVQVDTGNSIKILRTDNGSEFINKDMLELMERTGITHQKTCPYTPEQNGRAEREMRTIVEAARTMIYAKNLSLKFWAEAVNTAVFVLNHTGPTNIKNKTPYELWHGDKSKINRLKVFGSECFVHIPKEKRRKWDKKSQKGIMVGFEENAKGYRVWIPEARRIEISRDVIFNEDLKQDENVTHQIISTSKFSEDVIEDNADERVESVNSDKDETSKEQQITPIKMRLRSAKKTPSIANLVYDYALISMHEPKSYTDATRGEHSEKWQKAMDEEMESLHKNHTWDLVDLPKHRSIVDNKWVFKIKAANENESERFKARLVARGFTQKYGIDYEETFSPVVKFTSIRTILTRVAAESLAMKQFDIKTAFLNGILEEEIYMKQPEGYSDGTNKVCRLNKGLYGLKQGSRCWNEKFTNVLKTFHLEASQQDPCVFVSKKSKRNLILAIYVDDGLVAGSEADIMQLLEFLREHFEVKMFDAKHFLGLEIRQLNDGSTHLSQASYTIGS